MRYGGQSLNLPAESWRVWLSVKYQVKVTERSATPGTKEL
jgi:hypothetical protein